MKFTSVLFMSNSLLLFVEESPRLLQDCDSHNLPLHVKLAQEAAYEPLTENTEQTTTSTDVLLTVIYSLMLECGFVPAQYGVLAVPSRGYNRMNIQQFSKPPKQWLDQGCNLLRFSLALCPELPVRLIAVTSAESLLLTVSEVSTGIGHSICVQPDHFIVPSKAPGGQPFELRNIRELAFTVKDKLCNPARCDILKLIGVENPSLMGLPREVLTHMVKFLPAEDLARLGSVCRTMYEVTSDPKLWMSLVHKDFRLIALSDSDDEDLDWKAEYGSLHNRKKRARRQHASIFHSPYYMI